MNKTQLKKSLASLPQKELVQLVVDLYGSYPDVKENLDSLFAMDKEAARDVLLHCLKMDWPLDLQVYTDDGIYYASPLETADPEFLRIHQPTTYQPMDRLLDKVWIKTVLLEREVDALAPMRAYLKEKGVKVYDTMVGNYMTSIEMAGFSLTLLRLDDEMKKLSEAAPLNEELIDLLKMKQDMDTGAKITPLLEFAKKDK